MSEVLQHMSVAGLTTLRRGLASLVEAAKAQESDPESGLYYYGARYYDPLLARFISPDPVVQAPGDPQTLNRFAYCRNNPLRFTDPTGLDFWDDLGNFFEGFAVGFAGAVGFFVGGPILAGMAAGAVSGAFSGDITKVLQGAGMGALGALIGPAGMAIAFQDPTYLVGLDPTGMAGLGYSAANGDFGRAAGGILGGMAGTWTAQNLPSIVQRLSQLGGGQMISSDLDRRYLSYNQVKGLVTENNLSGQSDEMIIAMAYKESTFNPDAESSTSSAIGLLGVTKGAAEDAGYDYSTLSDPATNIQAGSSYLKLRIAWTNGDVSRGLAGYGTGSSYASSILQAENALQVNPQNPMAELQRILHK